jgi:aminoglycoside 3-N-acetyltransferase I
MMDLVLKKITSEETPLFMDLLHVFEEVFEWENYSLPKGARLEGMLNNRAFMVFVAMAENQVVGGLTAHVLERYDAEKPAAYIYDLAVAIPFQRKGIGHRLIETLTAYCRENGFSEAFVQADKEDQHAIDFYRKTAISQELEAVHFTYSF